MEYVTRTNTLRPIIEQLNNDPTIPHHKDALGLWYRVQDGILPFAGGWLEQPAWFVEDMNYIGLVLEYESLPLKLAKNKAKIQELSKSR